MAPVQFHWGTFCKQAVVNNKSGEVSLLSLVPGLVVEYSTDSSYTAESPVVLPFRALAVCATFRRLGAMEEPLKLTFDVSLTFGDLDLLSGSLEFQLRPNHDFGHSILNIEEFPLTLPRLGTYPEVLRVKYGYNATPIGQVELPIRLVYQGHRD